MTLTVTLKGIPPHAWASRAMLVVYIWGVTQMGVLSLGEARTVINRY